MIAVNIAMTLVILLAGATAQTVAATGLPAGRWTRVTLSIEGGKARISFDSLGGGLITARKQGRAPAMEEKGAKLQRFAIAGADKQWQWADAVIEGDTVVVSSEKVLAPVAVRYAYSSNPDGANLYNHAGLPASPFRTDNW